ncbi:hypothetical protein ABTK37_19170, partial [Acinetobacter baumannii]
MRALPASAVLGWGKPSVYRGFGPAIDGRTVTADLSATFKAGQEARVPLIIGFNALEFPIALMGGASALPMFVHQSPIERAGWIAAYGSESVYTDQVASDVLFRAPAYRLAQAHA